MTCHFVERWSERGLPEEKCGWQLQEELKQAYVDGELDRICRTPSGNYLYRFLVAGVPFGVVFRDGWPATVYDQSGIRQRKKVWRAERKPRRTQRKPPPGKAV